MEAHALRALAIGLGLLGVVGHVWVAEAQAISVTPYVGYETSGAYPLENPTAVEAFRANAGRLFGVFLDYAIGSRVQAEFQWAHNPTTYSTQDSVTGQYAETFLTSINQYQFGALYYLRDTEHTWRTYVTGSFGLTHDSNAGGNPGRTVGAFGFGGGVIADLTRNVGFRADAHWMPTYGSGGVATACDEFGDCYPMAIHNYLQRFALVAGITIRP